jgi:hypothetical protein
MGRRMKLPPALSPAYIFSRLNLFGFIKLYHSQVSLGRAPKNLLASQPGKSSNTSCLKRRESQKRPSLVAVKGCIKKTALPQDQQKNRNRKRALWLN